MSAAAGRAKAGLAKGVHRESTNRSPLLPRRGGGRNRCGHGQLRRDPGRLCARPGGTCPVTLTASATPSMLVAVTGPGGMSTLIRQVITATARPREDLNVLRAAQRGRALITSISPSPVRVAVPGQPAPPGLGASAYQQGQYEHALTHWRGEVEGARRGRSPHEGCHRALGPSVRLPVAVTGCA